MLDGLIDPTLIFTHVKNEIEVDKLDSTTTLEDYLNYKREGRKVVLRKYIKKKHEEELRKNVKLTHESIMGTIVEIEPKTLKINTMIDSFEVDLWFPKFSIIKGYKEVLGILQEFMIKKKILWYKREEALGKSNPTTRPQLKSDNLKYKRMFHYQ